MNFLELIAPDYAESKKNSNIGNSDYDSIIQNFEKMPNTSIYEP
jgi:hypothetical protein